MLLVNRLAHHLLMATGMVFGLLLCPPAMSEEPAETLLVGFAQDHMANDWRLAQVRDLERGLASHPGIRFIYTDAGGSTARQILDIEDLIQSGVDILVTSPRDSVAMTSVIAQAHRRGIKVILLTRKVETEDYTSYISPDDTAIARDAARYIANKLHGKGRVLILQGVPTATTARDRTEAFLDELQHHPGVEVVAIKPANYLRNDAIRAMEEVVAQGLEFDAIYAQSDSMASGARLVMHRHGIDPSSVVTVGIDYITEARDAILAGQQTASFTYPTSAREAVEVILQMAAGNTVPRNVVVPSQQVDATNVREIEPIF